MVYNENKFGEVMSKRTIAKFCVFVICAACFPACGYLGANGREDPQFDQTASPYDAPKQVGRLESKAIHEASGLASSKCYPDVLWTHNDSGDDAFLFAISTTGKHLGAWKVTGAVNEDWEDIEAVKTDAGECKLYIGDIGNNGNKGGGTIYRINEPKIDQASAASTTQSPLATDPAEASKYTLDTKSDAETLLVNPTTGDMFILTKKKEGPSVVYKIAPSFGGAAVQGTKIAEISLPAILIGMLTGGDVSADGKRVVLCDYVAGYELTLPGGSKNFDEIFKQKPVRFDIGKRGIGETVTYSADGNSVYSTSEGVGSPIFQMTRK